MPIGKQPEQVANAVIKEIPVTTCLRIETHHFEVTQRFQRVTKLIYFVTNRQNLQLLTALGIEEEQQTVDDSQAVILHLCLESVIRIVANRNVVMLFPVIQSLIGQCLDSKDHTFLQVFCHLVGVLVALLDETVHQHRLTVGSKGFLATKQVEECIMQTIILYLSLEIQVVER